MVKVSIVVPVYNVEKYLPQCLDSLCAQTLKDIEIICVNDGSKDNSLGIIQEYQKKDSRVKCISKANSGYGNSMNMGMDAAQGEYIAIAESDDFIEPDTCQVLYERAKELDFDVVKSDYYTFYETKGSTEYVHTCPDPAMYNVVFGYTKAPEVFECRMNTWTGIYRTQFLRENNIRHNETPGASYQDNGFWFQTITLAKKLTFVNQAFYHYRQDNPNSSINSKSKIHCMSDEYDFIYDFMNRHEDIHKKYMVPYFKRRFFNCMTTYKRVSYPGKLLFLERFSADLKKLLKDPGFRLQQLNDSWMESIVERIIDDYEMFFYEDTMYVLDVERREWSDKLTALWNSQELKKGMKIRSVLKRKK